MAHFVVTLALLLHCVAWRAFAASGQEHPRCTAEPGTASETDVACDALSAGQVGRQTSTESMKVHLVSYSDIQASGLLQVSSKTGKKVSAGHWGTEEEPEGAGAAGLTEASHQSMLQAQWRKWFKDKVKKVIDTVTDIKDHVGDAWDSLPKAGKAILAEHWHHVKNLDFDSVDSDKLVKDIKEALGNIWDDLRDDVKKVIEEHWGAEEESDIGTDAAGLLQVSIKAGQQSSLQTEWRKWFKDKVKKVINTITDIKDHVGDAWDSLPKAGKVILSEHWKHVKNLDFDSDKLVKDIKEALGDIWDDLSDDVKKVIEEHWGTEEESDIGTDA